MLTELIAGTTFKSEYLMKFLRLTKLIIFWRSKLTKNVNLICQIGMKNGIYNIFYGALKMELMNLKIISQTFHQLIMKKYTINVYFFCSIEYNAPVNIDIFEVYKIKWAIPKTHKKIELFTGAFWYIDILNNLYIWQTKLNAPVIYWYKTNRTR